MKWKVITIPANPDGYLKEVCEYYNLNRFWIANNYDSQLILQDINNSRNFYFSWYENSEPQINKNNNIRIFNTNTLLEFQQKYPFIYMIKSRSINPACALFANTHLEETQKLIQLANKNLQISN